MRQPEAIALYESSGYVADPQVRLLPRRARCRRCFGKRLSGRRRADTDGSGFTYSRRIATRMARLGTSLVPRDQRLAELAAPGLARPLVAILLAPAGAGRRRRSRTTPTTSRRRVLRPKAEARHQGAGAAGWCTARRRLRPDLAHAAGSAAPPSTRRAARSTGRSTRRKQGPADRPGVPRRRVRDRRRAATSTPWPAGWGSCTSSGTTTCTPRGTSSSGSDYLSSSCKRRSEVLDDAAPPRPHAHLAEPGRAAAATTSWYATRLS